MSKLIRRHRTSGQGGYTLVEVIISVAIASALMTVLVSVILTSGQAINTATSRVEASSQIRNFQFLAYDDFAQAAVPAPSGCGTAASPCTTQPLVLFGTLASNSATPTLTPYQVTYVWDGSSFVDRQVAATGSSWHAATNVTAFSWYVDANSTVIISLTVTVGAYAESQTFRFLPRLNP